MSRLGLLRRGAGAAGALLRRPAPRTAAGQLRPLSQQRGADAQLLYAASAAPSHRLLGHVERPERVGAALEALKAAGLTAHHQVRTESI